MKTNAVDAVALLTSHFYNQRLRIHQRLSRQTSTELEERDGEASPAAEETRETQTDCVS